MAERKEGSESKEQQLKKSEKERQRDEILENDPDREPPRTAQPPGDEPEWRRDEGC